MPTCRMCFNDKCLKLKESPLKPTRNVNSDECTTSEHTGLILSNTGLICVKILYSANKSETVATDG